MRSILLLIMISASFFTMGQSLETIIQKGHELAVIAVVVSPDSNYVATGSRDKSAKLWELSTGREVRSFLGHEATVNSLDFSSDGKYLITSSGDKSVRIWETKTGKEIYKVEPDREILTDVALSPDGKFFITGGYGDSARVYDFQSKKILAAIPVDPDKGRGYGISIAISPDSKWIGFGEDNRVATVYKTSEWKQTFKFEFTEGWCGGCFTSLAFSPDKKNFFMASHNGPVKKYNLETGQLVKQLIDKVDELRALVISPDGKKLMVAEDTLVTIYDTESGKLIQKIDPNLTEEINECAFTLDSKKILITSDDNTITIWDVEKNKKTGMLTGFLNDRDKGGLTYDQDNYWDAGMAKYVRFKNYLMISKNGKELIKGKFGTKVKRWDIASGKALMEYTGHKKAVLCYDLSNDGKRLVTGGGDGKIILWDTQSGDSIQTIQSYRHPILDIQFNDDETEVTTSSWDATMKIHDLKTKKLLRYWEFKEFGSAYTIGWGPNDLYLLSAQHKELTMWEIDSQEPVRKFIGHQDQVSSLQLSADQKTLLTASWDGSIRLWDIGTALMTTKLKGHSGAVHVAIYSADEKNVYSAGADRVIRFWDLTTSKVVRTFEGHNAEITSLVLSPDNKMLISHSVDGATKFWDLNSGKEFFEHIHFGEKEWMVKNPEGYFNGTQDARQYIHFVNGMKTYGVDQFFDEFYRPDLLPKIFQNRGNDEYKGIQGKLNTSPPPGVKVATLPGPDATQAEVLIRITDTGNGIENVKLFHNGKSIPIDKAGLKLPTRKGESTTYRHVISLVGGSNTITASASNKEKIESDPQSVEVFSERSGKSSVCYILSVGINLYKNPKMLLNYARPDAEAFGKVMDEKGSLFKNIELHSLYDAEASKSNILKKLEELSGKIHQEDVFIFYYAGHGSMVDNQFFFIPSESSRLYDLMSLQKDAIEASVLQEKLKNIKALKQLIVMDACQSGASVELLATRGVAEEKAIAQLSRSAGIHVMASAGSEQFATEFAELGHGLFTYLLIKALQGDADGAPKDGKVTIYELKSYLDDQVPEMTKKLKGKPQYPYTFSRGQDFPVVIENEK
ncbi:MAG: caspase family protein [Cyclobacteriaceae bacterium]